MSTKILLLERFTLKKFSQGLAKFNENLSWTWSVSLEIYRFILILVLILILIFCNYLEFFWTYAALSFQTILFKMFEVSVLWNTF